MASIVFLPLFLFVTLTSQLGATLSINPTQINSNSVLVALLDSRYTELAELVEKAMLLQKLEEAVTKHNLTIFAPMNEALERDLDPEFKRFLLEPGNIKSLQNLVLSHILPIRLPQHHWPSKTSESTSHSSLSNDHVELSCTHEKFKTRYANSVKLIHPDSIIRPDGIIHGIEKALIPKAVEHDFNNRRSLTTISAVKPESAPDINHRIAKGSLIKKSKSPVGSPPPLTIYEAMAPGPSLAPAPAPGPGGPHHHFDGESQVKDFIHTLLHYGGYNEMADILVNLTNLATEMGRLVSEGYVITVLAPNDEAMAKLTTEQLSESGSPEQIVYYHIIPEYQTEESMYNSVRRFGKVGYETLRMPHKIMAQESDGSVKFGHGDEDFAYLFDPDIYTDGRISVQGIDGVLFPPEEKLKNQKQVKIVNRDARIVNQPRRGKLLEVACTVLGALGQNSRFNTCQ